MSKREPTQSPDPSLVAILFSARGEPTSAEMETISRAVITDNEDGKNPKWYEWRFRMGDYEMRVREPFWKVEQSVADLDSIIRQRMVFEIRRAVWREQNAKPQTSE